MGEAACRTGGKAGQDASPGGASCGLRPGSGFTGGFLLERHCALDAAGHALMEQAVRALGLSARAYTRVLRLARTIADLDGKDAIAPAHVAEAISLRVLDRPQ